MGSVNTWRIAKTGANALMRPAPSLPLHGGLPLIAEVPSVLLGQGPEQLRSDVTDEAGVPGGDQLAQRAFRPGRPARLGRRPGPHGREPGRLLGRVQPGEALAHLSLGDAVADHMVQNVRVAFWLIREVIWWRVIGTLAALLVAFAMTSEMGTWTIAKFSGLRRVPL